jgi:parallel beta-helix repeat protein
MRSVRKWALGISILVVAVLLGTYAYTGQPFSGQQPVQMPTKFVEYPLTPHPAISIGGDSDFTTVAAGSGCQCVRYGSGTDRDPYVISGWIINASGIDGIQIFRTSVYFVITGVEVYSDHVRADVSLNQVVNGRIQDSSFFNAFTAVYALTCSNLAFLNDTITNSQNGIQLEASDQNEVSSNNFEQIGELAIFVRGSSNVVSGNKIVGSGFGGINVDGTSGRADGNIVEGNVVTDGVSYGIAMWRATNCSLTGNTVTRNGIGIVLTDHSLGNLVEGNNVTGNKGGGISIGEGSSGNTVKGNFAKGNGDGTNAFDLFDASGNNIWQNNTYSTKKPDTLQ